LSGSFLEKAAATAGVLVEVHVSFQRIGPQDVVVAAVLDAEDQSSCLIDSTRDRLESGAHDEVAEARLAQARSPEIRPCRSGTGRSARWASQVLPAHPSRRTESDSAPQHRPAKHRRRARRSSSSLARLAWSRL